MNKNNIVIVNIVSYGADGKEIKCEGIIVAKLSVKIDKITKNTIQYISVVKNLSNSMILGLKVMKALKIFIDTESFELKFKDESIKLKPRTTCNNIDPDETLKQTQEEICTDETKSTPYLEENSHQLKVDVNESSPVLPTSLGSKPTVLKQKSEINSLEQIKDESDQNQSTIKHAPDVEAEVIMNTIKNVTTSLSKRILLDNPTSSLGSQTNQAKNDEQIGNGEIIAKPMKLKDNNIIEDTPLLPMIVRKTTNEKVIINDSLSIFEGLNLQKQSEITYIANTLEEAPNIIKF